MALLELEDIGYRYSPKTPNVLSSINLSFEKGVMYALMGESGSGKTTLLSIIAKLDSPSEGRLYYNGKDASKLNSNAYRANEVAVIFQQYNLLTNYTALDNLIVALNISRYKGNCTKRAIEILNEVNLEPEKHKRLTQHLSGGEQQRVAIARAIVSNAEVILADEPTGSLDKDNSEIVMRLVMDLSKKHNKCMIIATHSNSIAEYSDEIIRISNGKILE